MLLFSGYQLTAQEDTPFKYTVGINSDNDAYIAWQNFDRYYSYGAGIRLQIRPERYLGLEKLLPEKSAFFAHFEVRSEGYTPSREFVRESAVAQDSLFFERPFAGLLYGTTGVTYVFERSFIRAEVLLGIMGPSALSKELQDWIHENLTGDGLLDGWIFQVPDQPIFNLNVSGAYDFTPKSKNIDFYAMGEARLGNLYIDARPLIGLRLGKFGPLGTSSALGNGVLADRSIFEFYLKSTFSGAFTLYNGTAQGNIFTRDFEYAVEDLNRFHLGMSHGLFVRLKRYSLGFDHIFTFGKVLKGVRHIYGRVLLEYSF